MNPRDKLMAPSLAVLLLRGTLGELINMCKKVVEALEWGDNKRCFERNYCQSLGCYLRLLIIEK